MQAHSEGRSTCSTPATPCASVLYSRDRDSVAVKFELHPKTRLHLSAPQGRDPQGAHLRLLDHPSPPQRELQQRRPQRAAQMRPALAPVQTGKGQSSPQPEHFLYVDAQRLQVAASRARDLIITSPSPTPSRNPAQSGKTVVQ